jgi:hypothetical protein
MTMNRRSFIRNLAIGGAAVAIAPNLSFSDVDSVSQIKDAQQVKDAEHIIVQIFWPNMKKQKADRDSVYIDLGSSFAAEFLVFEEGVFKSVVEPMLKEDKVKYQVN